MTPGLLALCAWLAAGALGWTLVEYVLHRGFGHRPGRLAFTREHLRHHREPAYFAPTRWKVASALQVLAALFAGLWLAASAAPAAAFTAGFGLMYAAYEAIHRRAHTHPPRGPYGRWARRHHFHHHFMNPRVNHGVTSPVWDLVFRTYARPTVIRVPAGSAMGWLVRPGEDEVSEPYRADYVLFRHRKAAA